MGVSVGLMKEKMSSSTYKKIDLLKNMLTEHEANLMDYFQNDEKGKLLPNYLTVVFEEIQQHKTMLDKEVSHLQQQYNIIKDILRAEDEITGQQAFTEKVFLTELVDSSINTVMTKDSMLVKQITLNKDYKYNSYIITDKTHLMQVIINLLKNAKESVMELDEGSPRKINISIGKIKDDEKVELRITDNGLGILPENLPKLFTFGFTTKKKGHGFGLHNAALTAKKLGGTLEVESMGLLKGAIFILTLPIIQSDDSSKNSKNEA